MIYTRIIQFVKNLIGLYWLSTSDAYVCTSLDDCNSHGQPIGLFHKCYGKTMET